MSRGPQSASPGRIKGATHLCELASSWGPFLSWTSLQASTRAIAAHQSKASAARGEESLRRLPHATSPHPTSPHPTQLRQPRRPHHPRHPRRPATQPQTQREGGRGEGGSRVESRHALLCTKGARGRSSKARRRQHMGARDAPASGGGGRRRVKKTEGRGGEPPPPFSLAGTGRGSSLPPPSVSEIRRLACNRGGPSSLDSSVKRRDSSLLGAIC